MKLLSTQGGKPHMAKKSSSVSEKHDAPPSTHFEVMLATAITTISPVVTWATHLLREMESAAGNEFHISPTDASAASSPTDAARQSAIEAGRAPRPIRTNLRYRARRTRGGAGAASVSVRPAAVAAVLSLGRAGSRLAVVPYAVAHDRGPP